MGAKLRYAALIVHIGLAGMVLLSSGCGTAQGSGLPPGGSIKTTPADPAALPAVPVAFGLPPLPDDTGKAPGRHLSSVDNYDGVSRVADSATGITPNPNNQQWLKLDGTLATPAAWAIWRIPGSPDGPFQKFQINVKPNIAFQSGDYYVAYGNYALKRWVFYDLANHPLGQFSTITINPGTLPGGEVMLHSPAGYCYIAVLVVGHATEVKGIDVTTPTPDPPPGFNSIFDQFENNDSLPTCWPLTPGTYHASIHQSSAPMADPLETRDAIDCYCVDVPNGKTLTATLRHEVYDHFASGSLNDCDLMFYFPGASSVYNDFNEALSSTGIFYDPFEQVNYVNNTGSDTTITLGVIGDISQPGVRNDAEYDISIAVSDAVHQVNGTITQSNQQTLKADVVAFLTPGNYNANTPVPGSGQPGIFSIQGVPPGTYELHVHSSARLTQPGYEWPEKLTNIVVSNNEVTGLTLDIGPDPT